MLPPDLRFADDPWTEVATFCLAGGGGGSGCLAGNEAGRTGRPAAPCDPSSGSGSEVGIGYSVGDESGPTGEGSQPS